jgi:hypothetical protein
MNALLKKSSKLDLLNRVDENAEGGVVNKKKKSNETAFTQEIDRQIIEGFLKDQKTSLDKLTNTNLSKGSISKRAIELGLNKDFLKLTKKNNANKPTARKCLHCGKYFASVGAHNRLCARCRKE